MSSVRRKLCYIVAPDGQAGGGMGKVKDYILEANRGVADGLEFRPLITRDNRGFLISLLLTARAVFSIVWAQLTGRLALVHVNFGDKASGVRKGIIVIVSRLFGAKVILHLHAVSLDRQYNAAPATLRWLIRQPFAAASCCVVLGQRWADWLVDDLHIRANRVVVLLNGVPVAEGKPKESTGAVVNALFLGNLLERKGVSDLLNALSLLGETNHEWRCTLAGGGNIPHYAAIAEELGLSSRVEFPGWLSAKQCQDRLRTADFLVLPSYEEGLPLVILEALGCGTPVLCTPVGAIPEALEDMVTAVFCETGNPRDLAQKLASLIDDAALRRTLSENGLDAYAKRFSLPAFNRNLLTIYRSKLNVSA